jgi:GTP-binding protein YchF
VASHPFSTTQTEIGVAHVPDPRLDALAEMSRSRKVVPATFEVVDIGAIQKASERSEALGGRFLAGLREVDALCIVLRSFHDDAAPGSEDPLEALSALEIEMVLADAGSLEAQLRRATKRGGVTDQVLARSAEAGRRALQILEEGVPIYRSVLDRAQVEELRPLFLLTSKPILVVLNIGEDQLGQADEAVEELAKVVGGKAEVLAVSVQLEAEARRLQPSERSEMLEGLGLGEGALLRVAHAAWRILGRQVFFTTGEKESRAWTFRQGATAPECAGVIHSDLRRGFIKADVIAWDELLKAGSFAAARQQGKVRLEGKDYAVEDGDVLEIRFNV